MFKTFAIYEKFKAQFRAESLNVMNTPVFYGPNTTFTNPQFGVITSQANYPRLIQLGVPVLPVRAGLTWRRADSVISGARIHRPLSRRPAGCDGSPGYGPAPRRDQGGFARGGDLGSRADLPDIRPRTDVVIDLILSSGAQAEAMMEVFRGKAQRVLAASSIDVYRACGVLHGSEDGPLEPVPLTESSALRTRLETYPPPLVKMLQQAFGWLDEKYDKIPVERAVLGDPELPGTILRLPMIYGPGDRLHRFHPIVRRIDDGRRAILMEEGMAAWRSPRGYVENVAAAIALAAVSERAAGRIYNVAERPAFSELEWAQRIARTAGWTGGW